VQGKYICPVSILITESFCICSGELKIAEVASRFTDTDAFVSLVARLGFRLASKVGLLLLFIFFHVRF
jgi:hypothetical protein